MQYAIAQVNRLGNRTYNQDRMGVVVRGDHLLLMVADGMGGHERGELAAQELIVSMAAAFQKEPLPIAVPQRFLQQAMDRSHDNIVALGRRQEPPIYPRTTAAVVLVGGEVACWAHIGDSRIYLIRDQEVASRTRDHTYVEDLLRHNAITEEELATHPLRNIVTYCLGGPERPPLATVSDPTPLAPGDVLLLCSDGFWGALDPERIARELHDTDDLDATLAALATAAEEASYPYADNITAVVLRCLDEPGGQEAREDAGALQPGEEEPTRPGDLAEVEEAIRTIREALRRYDPLPEGGK
ncbi:MAG TPA: serine/threonine-protein phosphatase [Thiotrichales bacterium]|nr:serine/threonine-protein phosphatase [Thiotrichales bacterium]